MRLPADQRVRTNKCRKIERIFADGSQESAIFAKLFMEKREHCVTGKLQRI